MRIACLHPSPIHGVRRGGRRPVSGHELLTTPVDVPVESGRSAFRPPGSPARGDLHGGLLWEGRDALWTMLTLRRNGTTRHLRADDFAAVASGRPSNDPQVNDVVRSALAFTPMSRGPHGFELHVDVEADGAPERFAIDPRRLRDGAATEAERTRERLAAWVSRNVVVWDDAVLLRSAPYVQFRPGEADLVPGYRPSAYTPLPVRPSEAAAFRVAHGLPEPEPGTLDAYAAFAARLEEDDTAPLANWLASGLAAACAEALVRPSPRVPAKGVRASTEALAALRPWAERGAIGGISADEAADVLALCARVRDEVVEAGIDLPTRIEERVMEAERSFLPRAGLPDPEDAAGLALSLG